MKRRARVLVHEELVGLLRRASVRAEVVNLARETWPSEPEALEQLDLLADYAWVAAADETATPSVGGRVRIELLMRAASLARLLCLHLELLAREPVGARRVLELAERLVWGELDESESRLPVKSQRWRTHVRAWTRAFGS
ncbi:hypothetical protein ACNOYE_05470 [Nannocystaceae bacterium ST9]